MIDLIKCCIICILYQIQIHPVNQKMMKTMKFQSKQMVIIHCRCFNKQFQVTFLWLHFLNIFAVYMMKKKRKAKSFSSVSIPWFIFIVSIFCYHNLKFLNTNRGVTSPKHLGWEILRGHGAMPPDKIFLTMSFRFLENVGNTLFIILIYFRECLYF